MFRVSGNIPITISNLYCYCRNICIAYITLCCSKTCLWWCNICAKFYSGLNRGINSIVYFFRLKISSYCQNKKEKVALNAKLKARTFACSTPKPPFLEANDANPTFWDLAADLSRALTDSGQFFVFVHPESVWKGNVGLKLVKDQEEIVHDVLKTMNKKFFFRKIVFATHFSRICRVQRKYQVYDLGKINWKEKINWFGKDELSILLAPKRTEPYN